MADELPPDVQADLDASLDKEMDKAKKAVFDFGNSVFGAVVGSAIADAVGAGYEFSTGVSEDEQQDIGPIGGGPFNWKPGQWTDDSEQAVALLTALSVPADEQVTQAAKNILEWYVSEPADIGTTTLTVLRSALKENQVQQVHPVEACFTAARRHAVASDTHRLDRSPLLTTMQGCGALMRLSSCALLPTEIDAEQWAIATSMLTHGSVHVADLSAALGQIIWRAAHIDNVRVDQLFRGVFNHFESDTRKEWETLISADDERHSERLKALIPFNGTAPGALACALAAIVDTTVIHGNYRFNPELWFKHCIQHAVAQGGDTDSVAAIVGSIAGGIVGYRHLPATWKRVLHGFNHEGTALVEDNLIMLCLKALTAQQQATS